MKKNEFKNYFDHLKCIRKYVSIVKDFLNFRGIVNKTIILTES